MNVTGKKIGFGTLIAVHETPPGLKERDNTGAHAIMGILRALEQDGYTKSLCETRTLPDGSERIFFAMDRGKHKSQLNVQEILRKAGVTSVGVKHGKKAREFLEKWSKGTAFEKLLREDKIKL